MNRKCVYLTEGECEENLIAALKQNPVLGPSLAKDRKSTRLNSSHIATSRMPSSA